MTEFFYRSDVKEAFGLALIDTLDLIEEANKGIISISF